MAARGAPSRARERRRLRRVARERAAGAGHRVADGEADLAVVVGPPCAAGRPEQRVQEERCAEAQPAGSVRVAREREPAVVDRALGVEPGDELGLGAVRERTLMRSTSRSSRWTWRDHSGPMTRQARRMASTYARSHGPGARSTGRHGPAGCPASAAAAMPAASWSGATADTASSCSPIVPRSGSGTISFGRPPEPFRRNDARRGSSAVMSRLRRWDARPRVSAARSPARPSSESAAPTSAIPVGSGEMTGTIAVDRRSASDTHCTGARPSRPYPPRVRAERLRTQYG